MLAALHYCCPNRCHGVSQHIVRPSVQAGAVLCSWSRNGWLNDEGWDLQAVWARAQAPPLRAPHHSHIGQGAHGPCEKPQARFHSASAATSGHIIQEESVIRLRIRRTAAGCGTSTPGQCTGPRRNEAGWPNLRCSPGGQLRLVAHDYKYFTCNYRSITVTCITCSLHVTVSNYMFITCLQWSCNNV